MVDDPRQLNAVRRHAFLSEFAETAAREAMRAGMTEDQAVDMGNRLADWVRDFYGGQHIYFVKDAKPDTSERDLKICAAMSAGRPADSVAAEHGLSYVRVLQIYKRHLAELRAKAREAQRDIFLPD